MKGAMHRRDEQCSFAFLTYRLVQQFDLAAQIRQRLIDRVQPEPVSAHGGQLIATVGQFGNLSHRSKAADFVKRGHTSHTGLPAFPNRDHAELPGLWPGDQITHQLPIPLLEDVER